MNRPSNIATLPKRVASFIYEARQELKNVQWPTRQATLRSTMVILVVSLVVAIATGVLDIVLTRVVEFILR